MLKTLKKRKIREGVVVVETLLVGRLSAGFGLDSFACPDNTSQGCSLWNGSDIIIGI